MSVKTNNDVSCYIKLHVVQFSLAKIFSPLYYASQLKYYEKNHAADRIISATYVDHYDCPNLDLENNTYLK